MRIENSKMAQSPVKKTQRTYEKRIMPNFGINAGNIAKKPKKGFMGQVIDFFNIPKAIKELRAEIKKNKELTEKNKELVIKVKTLDYAVGIFKK